MASARNRTKTRFKIGYCDLKQGRSPVFHNEVICGSFDSILAIPASVVNFN